MNWILDLDGVVWRGNEAIDGSVDAIARLKEAGQKIYFVTNNSLLTVSQYVKKMASFEIEATEDQIITSAMAAASLLDPSWRVYLIGGGGLKEAIENRGVTIAENYTGVDAVVLGWDPEINFEKMSNAMTAIRSGAKYIVTNADLTYPNPDRLLPGTGSIAAAVTAASGVNPQFAGKPNEPIAALIRPKICSNDVMVGDRISTDGVFARLLGVHFGLVKTGVNEDPGDFDLSTSTTVCEDLRSMVSIFLKEGSLPDGSYLRSRT